MPVDLLVVDCWYNQRQPAQRAPVESNLLIHHNHIISAAPVCRLALARAIHEVLTIKYQIKPADRWRENIHTEDPGSVLQLE